MGWWGKVIGGAFGYLVGGPLGALLGAAIGHNVDLRTRQPTAGWTVSERERVQTAFFTATFSVMGHLAKADGRVSEREIQVARSLMSQMHLSPELTQAAIRLFREGKDPGFPLDEVLDQFRRECHGSPSLLRMFIEIQLQAAYADGLLGEPEERLLVHLCDRLGFPQAELARLQGILRAKRSQRSHGGGVARADSASLRDAYALLNVSADAPDSEVKKAYRRLMNQHHPDKLVAKGLPEEMMRLAARKTQDIRAAYERIRVAREMSARP